MIEILLAGGADIDARTEKGETPLHLASAGGRRAAAQLLLSSGADPSPNEPLPLAVPLARRPRTGDKIAVGPDGELTMFGTSFDSKGFIEQFSSFDLFHHLLLVDNGVIQGLVSAIGASSLGFVCDFNLFHTGGLNCFSNVVLMQSAGRVGS